MALWLKTNLGSRGNARQYWIACAFQGWPGTHKDFRFWAGLHCESKDWVGNSQNSMASWTTQWVSDSLGSHSQFKGVLDQKDLKTKLVSKVSTRLGLGTLGNTISDLLMQNSYGIMLRHQNQNKTPTSRNPFHYWYPSETGSPKLWQVNCLDSSKYLLHRCPFFYDLT
jgi:hypothetical protein